jgi:hypothetical protein
MTFRNLSLRALKIWIFAALALSLVHRLRDGNWNAALADAGWAALAAVLVVASQRWHAARGAACALCVDAPQEPAPERADHV